MSGRKRKHQGNPTPFKGEFSFVNKDATNIGSKDHNAAVSWHVVNRYERWKKQEQAKKLRGLSNVPSAAASPAEGSTGIQALESPDMSYPPDPWQIDKVEQSMLGQETSSSAAQTQSLDTDAELTGSTLQNSPLDTTLLETMQLPPLVASVLSYAYGVVVPNTWPNEMGKAKWTYEISRTWEDMTTVNEDSCYASATLCFYATLMGSATGSEDLASRATFFQNQAMYELRQRISDHTGNHDASTMKAILRLFSAETALDNTSTARLHLKTLRNIVVAEGGIILLDSWFRENLLASDSYFALKYETRPLFPASEWTPGPLSQPWKARLASAKIGSDHAPTVDAVVDGGLKSIIADLRELFRVERYINSHDVPFDDQLLRWRQLRKYDCISRLADHQLNVKIYPHLFVRPKLQLSTCAAIALVTALVLGSPEPVRFGLKLIKELRTKVVDARAELEQEIGPNEDVTLPNASNIIFWILYVGSLGEQTHPISQQDRWFGGEVAAVSKELGLRLPKDQQGVAKRFLFSPNLASEIEDGRASRVDEVKSGVYEAGGMSWRRPLESIPLAVPTEQMQMEGAGRKGKEVEE